jgi:hypothetical protein
VALVAQRLGDVEATRTAAHRVLAETADGVPEMLVIAAVDAARMGAYESAVAAAERASAGMLACHVVAPLQVARALVAAGERDHAGWFLAEGLKRTNNVEYAAALEELGPAPRVLQPRTNLIVSMGVLALAWVGMLIHPAVGAGVFVVGFAALIWATIKPFGGFSMRVRKSVGGEWQRFQMRNRKVKPPEPAAPQHCRCWEVDAVAGPRWTRYLTEHLEPVAEEPSLAAQLRRCPGTEKLWLCLPQRAAAVGVRVPEEVAKEAEPAGQTGQYL